MAMDLKGPRRALVQAVSQVSLAIPSESAVDCFDQVRDETLRWMARRAGIPLPRDAWAGRSFELQDVGAQRTAAVALASPRYWAARMDDADKAVAQRTWTTEIGIGMSGQEVLFGCRLYCAVLGENPPYGATIPGFVKQIAARFSAELDRRPLRSSAWRIESGSDIDELVEILCVGNRKSPVIALADGRGMQEPLVDSDQLASALLGVAHVVRVSAEASYELTRRLGKEFSVFDRAVRTYRAGFDPDRDEPARHPIAFAHSIATWSDKGPEDFKRFLVDHTIRQSVSRTDLERDVPSFAAVLVKAGQEARIVARRQGQSDSELLAMAMEEVKQLEGRAQEDRHTYEGLLAEAERERDVAVAIQEEARAEAANLRSRIANLEHALAQEGSQPSAPVPDSLEELGEWASVHLAGSVRILNRAQRAAKKSEFADPQFVYEVLLALRDFYVPMRRNGGADRANAYRQRLAELGLEESSSFAGGRAGEQREEYFVEYGGRRRELDRHLKGSNSRDERFGFRLYFFWDDESYQVIVGWLPSHLTTRAS